MPSILQRPCALVGVCLSFLFAAALLDAALWQHGSERKRLRIGAATAAALVQENTQMRVEIRELREQLLRGAELESPAECADGGPRQRGQLEQCDPMPSAAACGFLYQPRLSLRSWPEQSARYIAGPARYPLCD